MAVIEAVPLLIIFVMLVSFGLGFYGIVHSATLNSIGARTYAFALFRNRTNLKFHREEGSGLARPLFYGVKGYRYHAITHEFSDREQFVAPVRPISIGRAVAASPASPEAHNTQIYEIKGRNQKISINPVWLMNAYGMCVDARCGD